MRSHDKVKQKSEKLQKHPKFFYNRLPLATVWSTYWAHGTVKDCDWSRRPMQTWEFFSNPVRHKEDAVKSKLLGAVKRPHSREN